MATATHRTTGPTMTAPLTPAVSDEIYPRIRDRVSVIEQIMDGIFRGALPVGERISERQIASLLGRDTRTPIIREAIAVLVREGVITSRPQSGHRVESVSATDAISLLNLRGGLETVVVRGLVAEPTAGSLDRPRRLLWEMRSLAEGTRSEEIPRSAAHFLTLDRDFRCALAITAGFHGAVESIYAWSNMLHIFRLECPPTPAEMTDVVERHHQLLDCIERGDDLSSERVLRAAEDAAITRVRAGFSANELTGHMSAPGDTGLN